MLPDGFTDLYEIYSYHHALEVLSTACAEDFQELLAALMRFRLTNEDILTQGGNESPIPKRINELLRPLGWNETRIKGDLCITKEVTGSDKQNFSIENYLDGHKIDYVKGRIAFDLEWNSKDQTFDRDLYAFRAFHEAGVVSVAVLLTRSEALNPIFKGLGVMSKYGASTTWMGKLIYRLNAGRHGGCPILALGMKPTLIGAPQ